MAGARVDVGLKIFFNVLADFFEKMFLKFWPVFLKKNYCLACLLNLGVGSADDREIEVLAQGLPCRGGRQMALDITLRSALTCAGAPRARAATEDGVVAQEARRDKSSVYPELCLSRRCE